MEKEKKDLCIFGFGMSLIIPYLVYFHSLSLGVHWYSVLVLLAGFSGVLWLTTKVASVPPKFNAWILAVQLLVAVHIIHVHEGVLSLVFLVIAAAFLLTSITRVEQLAPVYKVWMKIGHAISQVLTKVILGSMYYFVFTPMAIFFKITKKDYLTRTIDPAVSSYWIKRENKEFKPEQYTKQF